MATPKQPNQYDTLSPSSGKSLPQGALAQKNLSLAEMISVINELLGNPTQEKAREDLSEFDVLKKLPKEQPDERLIKKYTEDVKKLSDEGKKVLLESLMNQRVYELKALAASSIVRPAHAKPKANQPGATVHLSNEEVDRLIQKDKEFKDKHPLTEQFERDKAAIQAEETGYSSTAVDFYAPGSSAPPAGPDFYAVAGANPASAAPVAAPVTTPVAAPVAAPPAHADHATPDFYAITKASSAVTSEVRAPRPKPRPIITDGNGENARPGTTNQTGTSPGQDPSKIKNRR